MRAPMLNSAAGCVAGPISIVESHLDTPSGSGVVGSPALRERSAHFLETFPVTQRVLEQGGVRHAEF